MQDDELGSALTDAEGKFRIDYERADFTRTMLSPLVNLAYFQRFVVLTTGPIIT